MRGSFDCVVMSAAEDDTTLDALPAAYQQQNPKPETLNPTKTQTQTPQTLNPKTLWRFCARATRQRVARHLKDLKLEQELHREILEVPESPIPINYGRWLKFFGASYYDLSYIP